MFAKWRKRRLQRKLEKELKRYIEELQQRVDVGSDIYRNHVKYVQMLMQKLGVSPADQPKFPRPPTTP